LKVAVGRGGYGCREVSGEKTALGVRGGRFTGLVVR
jgi:hypothetical protein